MINCDNYCKVMKNRFKVAQFDHTRLIKECGELKIQKGDNSLNFYLKIWL